MEASIIISAYTLERLPDLQDAIDALEPQLKGRAEILLIVEDEKPLVEGLKIEFSNRPVNILVSSRRGVTAARNLGIEKSTGDIIIFLDDDAVPSDTWLTEILAPYSNPKNMGVGGNIYPSWKVGSRPEWFPTELDWLIGSFYGGHPKRRAYVRNIIGANMSFRREVFDVVGGFSTSIGAIGKKRIAGDDSEFCMRLRKAYGPNHILFIPEARVEHRVPPERQTIKHSLKRAYIEGVSKAVIARMFEGKTTQNLDTEFNHLIYLATKGIPGKLKKGKIGQFIMLILCTSLVLLGYMRGSMSMVREAI